jgi:hypothetical protein
MSIIPSTSISRLSLIALALATSVFPTAAQSTTGEPEVTTAASSSSDTPLHLRIARAYNDPARWDMEQLAEDTEMDLVTEGGWGHTSRRFPSGRRSSSSSDRTGHGADPN